MRSALQLVETIPFHRRAIELDDVGVAQAHSLHYALPLPETISPEMVAFVINRFSKKGEIVLDPFAGAGTIPFEAAMLGRIPYGCDVNPLFARVSQSKTRAAELTDVTLALQTLQLNRPVDSSLYSEYFSAFFDIQTYRELIQLRDYVQSKDNDTTRFIELVSLGLLHGQSAGYFSTFTFPQISLRPEMQRELNKKRHQIPDYRAVIPRILRRTASLLRDGIPSVVRSTADKSRFACCDARNLNFIGRSGVSLVLSAPPMPGDPDALQDLWLRLWFAGISAQQVADRSYKIDSVAQWLEFMNSALLEMARVTVRGARSVLILKPIRVGQELVNLDDTLKQYVEEHLSQYWDPEASLTFKQPIAKLKDRTQDRDPNKRLQRANLLVLRRR